MGYSARGIGHPRTEGPEVVGAPLLLQYNGGEGKWPLRFDPRLPDGDGIYTWNNRQKPRPGTNLPLQGRRNVAPPQGMQAVGAPMPPPAPPQALPQVPQLAPRILPRVPQLAPRILPQVPQLAPRILPQVPQLAPQVLPQVPQLAPQVLPQVPQLAPQVLPQVPQLAPRILPQAPQLAPRVLPQAPQLAPRVLPQVPQLAPRSLPQVPQVAPQVFPQVPYPDYPDSPPEPIYPVAGSASGEGGPPQSGPYPEDEPIPVADRFPDWPNVEEVPSGAPAAPAEMPPHHGVGDDVIDPALLDPDLIQWVPGGPAQPASQDAQVQPQFDPFSVHHQPQPRDGPVPGLSLNPVDPTHSPSSPRAG